MNSETNKTRLAEKQYSDKSRKNQEEIRLNTKKHKKTKKLEKIKKIIKSTIIN